MDFYLSQIIFFLCKKFNAHHNWVAKKTGWRDSGKIFLDMSENSSFSSKISCRLAVLDISSDYFGSRHEKSDWKVPTETRQTFRP